ncbi:hypothetical protein BDV93DRAFT_505080 [Ceratobasidium sp. AG-I]|nr:hypothetical protein BDV93DRAFT_505080 [Ceratobasidium sp. AG-I]
MSLAYFGTLSAGPSGVAAIRFSVPVIIQTLRIIPTGVPAFGHVENCVGETSPSQFALKVYSNALMSPTDSEPKPKASNTLLSTQLDYVDEMLDWNFSITPQASSRLVIFQGAFEKLTIAIYGQLLSDSPTEQPTVVGPPIALPPTSTLSLPPSIDIANLADASQTAKSLLEANAANPPLRHVLHSMLCYVITPEGPFDEWDANSGNPVERLLESDILDAVELMQEAIQALRKPLPEIEEGTATQFASLVNESLGENESDSHRACFQPDTHTCKLLFEILGYASLQSDSIVTAILVAETKRPPPKICLKVYMGVSAALSVVWWSRFPPDAVACRALSVLKLWAECTGIREIVRASVLMPIFYEALSELTVDVPLHKSGLYAQQLLETLNISVDETEEPVPEVAATPEPPQLSGHLEVIVSVLKSPKLDDVTVKRVSLASQRILRQARENPEEPWSIFSDAHESTSETFMLSQIEILRRLSQFMDTLTETTLDVATLPAMANLLAALVNVIETISLLLPYANLPTLAARSLARLTTTVFISSDLILSRNRRQTHVVEQSHIARETCVQLLRTFVTLNHSLSGFEYPGAEHVLSQLLSVWTGVVTDSMHISVSQTAVLLDLLLPLPPTDDGLRAAQDFWVREVVRVMPQLEQLLAVLSPRHWISLVLHLVELDRGGNSVGVGAWFALNEVDVLKALVGRITLDADTGKLAVMLRVADRSISLLGTLLRDILRDETAELLVRDKKAVSTLVQCFEILVDHHATTASTAGLAAALAPYAADEPRALRRLLTTALFRGCRLASPFSSLLAIPALLTSHRAFATRDMDLDVFGTDIGLALEAICAAWKDDIQPAVDIWDAVVQILEWVAEYEDPSAVHLGGLSDTTLDEIRALVAQYLTPARTGAFDTARTSISTSQDVPEDLRSATSVISDTAQLMTTTMDVRAATGKTSKARYSTPPRSPSQNQFDILALASLSPRAPTSPVTPSAPLSLTKMYSQNEFRLLRHSPSARLNTSRPPSQHVDDWQAPGDMQM